MRALGGCGWHTAALNLRGCSGEPNRLARAYHSGDTADLDYVVRVLHSRAPATPRAIVGFSAGGNILLKWLGERGAEAGIAVAAAVSVPYRLEAAVEALHRVLFGAYERYFLASLLAKTREKLARLSMPVTRREVESIRSLRQFDDRVTARLHGFNGAADYYERASSRPWLSRIRVPTLLIHAADDPFMTPEVIPAESELSPSTRLELSPHGGHVGFVDGTGPWRSGYWLERRLPEFLAAALSAGTGLPPPASVARA